MLKQTQLRTGRPSKSLLPAMSRFRPHPFLNHYTDFSSQERANISSLWKFYITEHKYVKGTLEVFLCDPHSSQRCYWGPSDKEPTKVTWLPLLHHGFRQSWRSNISHFRQTWLSLLWAGSNSLLWGWWRSLLASTTLAPQPTISSARLVWRFKRSQLPESSRKPLGKKWWIQIHQLCHWESA